MRDESLQDFIHSLGQTDNEALKNTPDRWRQAIREMTAGYGAKPEEIIKTFHDPEADEIVILKGIPFVSLCEHHLFPFVGTATVGYLPSDGRVVGLSKLARVVDAFAMRFQMQERMTRQIANAIALHARAEGAGCVVRASHTCMSCRGIKKSGATMVTSSLVGVFRDTLVRSEVLALERNGD